MKTKLYKSLLSYKYSFASAFLFGCLVPASKQLSQFFGPQSLAGLMYLSAGIGLAVTLIIQRKLLTAFSTIQHQDRKWILLSTVAGGILGPVFLTYGLVKISGAMASLLMNLEIVFTTLIAWFVLKEHFERKTALGVLFILMGCLVLSISESKNSTNLDSLWGAFLILLACFSWGVDNNLTAKISHLNPVLIATIKGLIAGSTNLLLGILIREKIVFDSHFIQVSFLGFFCIGLSMVFFIESLGKIGTARTGAIFSTAPFMGALLSFLFLRDTLNFSFVASLFLTGVGVWLHLSEDHSHEHIHDEMIHTHEHIHDTHHQHEHESQFQGQDSHSHEHRHQNIKHSHPHFPDLHHKHEH